MTRSFHDGRVMLHEGDCREKLALLPDCSVDSVVTDPPYHLTSKRGGAKGFMDKAWDGGDIAFRPDVWRECLRVLKPGGHLCALITALSVKT
jgi:site-specific DNA-methyltransferase (adenine-specific)